jgi:hypothetical protein
MLEWIVLAGLLGVIALIAWLLLKALSSLMELPK